jgi:hypothetical protein
VAIRRKVGVTIGVSVLEKQRAAIPGLKNLQHHHQCEIPVCTRGSEPFFPDRELSFAIVHRSPDSEFPWFPLM